MVKFSTKIRIIWVLVKKIFFLILFVFYLIGTFSISYALECVNVKALFTIKEGLGLDQPSDLAVAPNRYIYIVDGANNRIVATDSDGRLKFTFGKEGLGKGEFKYPLGIDISDSGKVFIADSGNHRIQVFDLKGNFLSMFSVRRGSNEKPSDPADILVGNIRNYLYISDNDNHKIKVYKQDGTFQFEWGRFGEGEGEFRYTGILSSNKANEVFVVDVINTRVQKFDPWGKFITDIGSWGVLPGNFFRPKGVAVDRKNRVYVTDSYMGAIQVFTDLGRFIGVICENNKKKEFVTPVGIVIDKNDRVLAIEMRANKITVFGVTD